MTGREMQYHFEILARNGVLKDILSDEIFYWINNSIEFIIKNIFGEEQGSLNKFEITQKTKDDIQSIVKKTTLTPSLVSGKYVVDLPATYWFKVREQCTISYTNCNAVTTTKVVSPIEANMNNVDAIKDDPFSEYNLRYGQARPIRIEYDNDMVLLTDGTYSVTSYDLYYIQKPTTVAYNTTSDMPSEIHEDIVNIAYQMCSKNYINKSQLDKIKTNQIMVEKQNQ